MRQPLKVQTEQRRATYGRQRRDQRHEHKVRAVANARHGQLPIVVAACLFGRARRRAPEDERDGALAAACAGPSTRPSTEPRRRRASAKRGTGARAPWIAHASDLPSAAHFAGSADK